MTICDFCHEPLETNVRMLGLGGFELAPLYCNNHGIGFTKEKENTLKKSIQNYKSILSK